MKLRLEWLGSYLPGPLPGTDELGTRLTKAGFIVEGVEGNGPGACLEVEMTANRPDGMNHRGLAREASAALGRPFADPGPGRLAEGGRPAAELATVTIEEPSLCSRYSARVIEGIEVRPASAAVRERLEALGMNPISAPVDATNHVLWDIGQPLHAFDLDSLAKGPDGKPAIVVRRARAGERLVTLDGVERTLTPDHLVIADAVRPVALAGVMGGLETAISERTTRVLLESAHFDPGVVRRTARAMGLHTDASHRFERGTDPAATVDGLERAAALIVADCGGTVARGVIDVVAREVPRPRVRLRHARLEAFLGMPIPLPRCVEILRALQFEVTEAGPGVLEVIPPTWRVDVGLEVDLIEEVVRIVGYDELPEVLPHAFNPTWTEPTLAREERARDVLSGAGFVETCTYSFVSSEENAPFAGGAPGTPAEVANPLGEPFTTMRATPVIGLLAAARHNARRGQPDLLLFEVGRSYGMAGTAPRESRRATLLLHGRRQVHWSVEPRPVDFHDGSGAVAALFAGLGAPAPAFRPAAFPFLSPGRSARVVSSNGEDAGWVGVLAATVAARYDLTEAVVADVDLARIDVVPPPTTLEAPSRFPGSDVDLTVTHRLSLPWSDLVSAATAGAPPELLGVDARYLYRGPGVPDGFVKTTLTLRFGSAERSLSREEVNGWRDEAARRLLALPESRVDGF